MIEAAAGISVLVVLVLTALSCFDFANRSDLGREIVDQAIAEVDTHPFRLTPAEGQAPQLVVNEEALVTLVHEMATNARSALERRLSEFSDAPDDYFVEARYGVIGIAPATGIWDGSLSAPEAGVVRERGAAFAGDAELGRTDLLEGMRAAAALIDSKGANGALFAIPTAEEAIGGSGARYVDKAVLVGLRVIVGLDNGVSASFWKSAAPGSSERSAAVKVRILRGGVE